MKAPDDFYEKVYQVTRQIPAGRVTTYGAIARFLGTGRSARVVGWALNVCHASQTYTPAHRVVNRNGVLTGKHFFGTSSTMQQLLENEGITVKNDRVAHLSEVFWDPAEELEKPPF